MKLKNGFAIFLFVVFANFILAPTVISIVDSEADVSMVFNLNEEENKELGFEIEEPIELMQFDIVDFSFLEFSNNMFECQYPYYSKQFHKLHLPPPELS